MNLTIRYRRDGRFHVFTSDDVPGLAVASDNMKAAVRDLTHSVNRLMRTNRQMDVRVQERDVMMILAQHDGDDFSFTTPTVTSHLRHKSEEATRAGEPALAEA
ncbi:MAG: hypothetical protein HQL40_04290 [Alphaproteobacteria bacterium]|nr:hypothetical protein [Alphaproteobacteria bacterium]